MKNATPKKIIKAIIPNGALVIHRKLNHYKHESRNRRDALNQALTSAKTISETKNPKIVISLTTYGKRIKSTAPLSVASLFNQSVMPDKIILWLAHGEKPSRSLRMLENLGLDIRYTKDIKSYKKLIPTLLAYPRSTIITADDDVIYPIDWLEKMITMHKKNPRTVIFNRGRKILVKGGKIAPYNEWPLLRASISNSHLMLPTGMGGVLYPPKSLDKRVFNEDLYTSLAPNGDDLWFWAMAELNGVKRVMIKRKSMETTFNGMDNENGLFVLNKTANDTQLNKIMREFPILNKKIDAKAEETFPGSAKYWESRYATGGNSGSGSYNRLAKFKTDTLNEFVKNNNINTVIEFGSGDGNNLLTAKYPNYIGFDVSKTAVAICKRMFKDDRSKQFYTLNKYKNQTADMTMSLDVLYHLIEQDIFEEHIKSLFRASKQYVIIYAHDGDEFAPADHVKSRNFTKYIDRNIKDWELIKHIPNKYPYDLENPNDTTWADFYIYKKKRLH